MNLSSIYHHFDKLDRELILTSLNNHNSRNYYGLYINQEFGKILFLDACIVKELLLMDLKHHNKPQYLPHNDLRLHRQVGHKLERLIRLIEEIAS